MRPTRRTWLAAALATALGAGGATGCASFDEQQRRWVFQPSKDSWWGAQAADDLDDVWIEYRAEGLGATDAPVRLHGLWLPQPRADAPILLYLHGARWDVRSSANRMRRMYDLGFSVLGIDYRGFGKSTDALPSEAMAYEDAHAAWTWLGQQYPGRPRYVFGHSLGGAIAVQLASSVDDVAGLMVEGTFTSIRDVVSTFRWGWLPLGPLITQRFDAGARIEKLKAPLLVVHGSADTLIPPALGRALYERAPGPHKRFVLVEGGSHHDTNSVGHLQYRQAVAELFGLGTGR